MSQSRLAARIGRPQPWLSRYLGTDDSEEVELLETLSRIAKVFDHSFAALLGVPGDPDEQDIIDFYRKIRPSSRKALKDLLRTLAERDQNEE